MMFKIYLACVWVAMFATSFEKASGERIPTTEFLSGDNPRGGDRVQRVTATVRPHNEDELAGKKEEKDDWECGKLAILPVPLITYGERTERGQWPWHTAIYEASERNTNSRYLCGGTLVGRRVVITAANCVQNRTGHTRDPEYFLVYLGKHHLNSISGVQEMKVKYVVVHPSYSAEHYSANIAILILSNSAEFTSTVRPVCLWDDSLVVEEGTPGKVVGWGVDENGELTGDLKLANMPIVPQRKCIRSYRKFFGRYLDQTKFCAGYRNGTSACNGDSGGGMVFPVPKTPSQLQKWYLRGIVALAPRNKEYGDCDPMHYVIFTDVSKYLGWIRPYIC